MKRSKIAAWIAAAFFFLWLIIFYAIADHPLPRGFPLVVIPDLVCAVVVYLRVDAYIAWSRARRKLRWLLALRDGFAASLVTALIIALVPGRGDPAIPLQLIDYTMLFVMLSILGAANAIGVYILSALLSRRTSAASNPEG
jgi:hypothetical protein